MTKSMQFSFIFATVLLNAEYIQLVLGDDFDIIQQEIVLMQDCKHNNIVQYLGSYLRYVHFPDDANQC